MHGSFATRFLGGSPLTTAIRLALLSLVVGALLMWLNIEPFVVFQAAERMAERLWAMGFDAVREMGRYMLAGAVLVVPIWLVTRLFNLRSVR
jgi:hypothetical protein